MLKGIIFSVVILQLGATVTFGQDETIFLRERRNSIQVRYGFVHSRLIDDGYSRNLLFRGTNSKFGLGYSRETSRYLFNFLMEVSLGKVKSKSGDLPSDLYTVQPAVSYARKVIGHRFLAKENDLFIGAGLSSMTYFIINQHVFDNASLISVHGLSFIVTNRMQIDEKQRLQLSYQLPVAVYVNRLLWNGGASELTYSDEDHIIRALTTNGSFRYMDIFGNVQLSANYAKRVGPKTDFVVRYKFQYFRDAAEPSVRIYSNELLLGLNFLF